uniref:Pheromone binding protein 1 n=1 Tax=Sesamia nonagrioides TaxID=236805 RepID=Q5QHW0_9NEOP|nr:pheromone binding protein 1 precursor [Sesamia nonagrioides]
MADSRWWFASFICVIIMTSSVMSSKELVSKMSSGFSKVLDQCKAELNVGEHIMQDMYNFWREEYELVNRDLGCMVMCMASKLDLVGDDQKMHHGKAEEFAKSHGADDELAKQLVGIIHACETQHQAIEDPCSRTLEVAKCFRSKMHELKWAPPMEVAIEEIMTAV